MLIYLGFDLEELKPESWSRAPRTEVLPDRFVLVGITDGIRQEWPFPSAVPSPLILGPNPQDLESELAQRRRRSRRRRGLRLDLGLRRRDRRSGWRCACRLPEPFAARGFDRLMVLGLRVSDGPADHKALLEELIDNHHYSPDGMGFLPQGTPTNHTADARVRVLDGRRGRRRELRSGDRATPAPPATDDLREDRRAAAGRGVGRRLETARAPRERRSAATSRARSS